jgi:hypothetical protein
MTAVEAASAIEMIAEKNIVDGFVVVVMHDGGSENRKGCWSCLTKLNLGTNEEDVSSASLYRLLRLRLQCRLRVSCVSKRVVR